MSYRSLNRTARMRFGGVCFAGMLGAIMAKPAAGVVVTPTTGAGVIDVTAAPYFADATGATDSTGSFQTAINAASTAARSSIIGPDGVTPQTVVFVGHNGLFKINSVQLKNDVRVEISADTTIKQSASTGGGCLFLMSAGNQGAPVQNTSIVGVGSWLPSAGANTNKDRKNIVTLEPGWSIAPCCTLDTDAGYTGGDPQSSCIRVMNASYFLIQNMFSIQNTTTNPSLTAALTMKSSPASAIHTNDAEPPSDVFQPRYGTVNYWYNVNSPSGYGPNQINAADQVNISDIYTLGGTGLRLETDNSMNGNHTTIFGGAIWHLNATNIVTVNGNRAVSLSPHAQQNYHVYIKGVRARSCWQGVIESVDTSANVPGAFTDATLADVTVAPGSSAQNPANGAPPASQSAWAFKKDNPASPPWSALYSFYTCFPTADDRGTTNFTNGTDPVRTDINPGTGTKLTTIVPPNQLTNPGFEVGNGLGSWNNWGSNGVIINGGRAGARIHSGWGNTGSLEHAAEITASASSTINVTQPVSANPALNSHVTVTGYVRGDDTITGGANLVVTFLDVNSAVLRTQTLNAPPDDGLYQLSSSRYEFYNQTMLAPANVATVKVQLQLVREPTVTPLPKADFDDLSLTLLP